jgi:hypothetical protein
MSTWFQKQTPLFQGFFTFAVVIGAGRILNGLGARIAGPFLNAIQLMNVLFSAFVGSSVTYRAAKYPPSGVSEPSPRWRVAC